MLALPSTGVHSNGFSLVRKVFDIDDNPDVLKKTFDGSWTSPWARPCWPPPASMSSPCWLLMDAGQGQGRFPHHRRRLLREHSPQPARRAAPPALPRPMVRIPALFDVMQREGGITEHDMFNTFNMGVGMVLTVAPEDADKAIAHPAGPRRGRLPLWAPSSRATGCELV